MKKSFFFYLLTLALCFSCKEDDPDILNTETDGCGISNFAAVFDQYPIISSPVANPNNPEEFAFLRDKYFSICCDQDLMVYNMATKELKKVFQGNIGSLEWSKQGWLFFNEIINGGIYKIKPNGDSLMLIDSFGYAFSLSFEGDLLFSDYYNSTDFTAYHNLRSLDGTLLKQRPIGFSSNFLWHHDSLLTVINLDGTNANLSFYPLGKYFDEPDGLPISSATISNIGYVTQFDWVDENTMIFSSEKGIYTVYFPNINSVVAPTQILKADCPRTGSVRFTLQRESNKLIAQRYTTIKESENQYLRKSSFVRTNFDGTDEEAIEILGL